MRVCLLLSLYMSRAERVEEKMKMKGKKIYYYYKKASQLSHPSYVPIPLFLLIYIEKLDNIANQTISVLFCYTLLTYYGGTFSSPSV